MLTVDLALAGLGIGAVAALAGLGLLVTFRATGVLNLAFGAIAMFAAYLLWAMVRVWHWPVGLAAAADLLVACPAFGLAVDRVVFRPLQRRAASPAESLVASLGVLVLLVGAAFRIWGGQARVDAPALVSPRRLGLPGGAGIRLDTLTNLLAVALIASALLLVARTRVGTMARAVVERRALAELTGIDADRVSALAWVVGTMLAGLAGILLAPTLRLEPYGLTLVMLETMAVAVIAGLASPGRAIAAALLIGVVQSELTQVHAAGHARTLIEALTANLFVVVLLLSLLVLRRLDPPGGDVGSTARLATRRDNPPPRGWWMPSLVLLVLPLGFTGPDLRTAQQVPALAIILVSIVLVSGYTGQISLGQAGFAGLGALLAAKLAAGDIGPLPALSGIGSVVAAVLAVVVVGFAVGWPTIRRRGLFLALATFASAAVASRLVFNQPAFVSGVHIAPPAPFTGDRAFYMFELICLAGALIVVRNHHRGRLGRALLAVRDDEIGARASGVDVRRIRIVAFSVSAGLAALGGLLLAESNRAFDATTFDPVQGLVWFAAVVVFGIDSAAGAVLAASLLIALDATFQPGISIIVIGVGAVLLGRLPGGVLHALRQLETRSGRSGRPLPDERSVVLSSLGLAVAERLRR